jgi:hypothetical protein
VAVPVRLTVAPAPTLTGLIVPEMAKLSVKFKVDPLTLALLIVTG